MRIRKLEQAVKGKNQNANPKTPMPMDLTNSKLEELKEEINRAQKDRKHEEKELRQKALEQEEEWQNLEHEVKVLELQVREKV